jgi:hypothetical protein
MGLGHCRETLTEVGAICDGWMRIIKDSQWGDAVSLESTLLPRSITQFVQPFPVDPHDGHFRLLVPRSRISARPESGFDLKSWLENPEDVRDYAIILRHTQPEQHGRRQVLFVVAGFTEIGTAAAGHYLARNWRELCEKHVHGRCHDPRLRGDFLIVIEGPSNAGKIGDWAEDKSLSAITPEKLQEHRIQCKWTERLSSSSPSFQGSPAKSVRRRWWKRPASDTVSAASTKETIAKS